MARTGLWPLKLVLVKGGSSHPRLIMHKMTFRHQDDSSKVNEPSEFKPLKFYCMHLIKFSWISCKSIQNCIINFHNGPEIHFNILGMNFHMALIASKSVINAYG